MITPCKQSITNKQKKKMNTDVNATKLLSLDPEIEDRYRSIMAPYNEALERLLGGKAPWKRKNAWSGAP